LDEEDNAEASEDVDGGSKKKGGIYIYVYIFKYLNMYIFRYV
jgi:hypothetical protein